MKCTINLAEAQSEAIRSEGLHKRGQRPTPAKQYAAIYTLHFGAKVLDLEPRLELAAKLI
jgi:hypothetical protein